jgi:hypothetical protein
MAEVFDGPGGPDYGYGKEPLPPRETIELYGEMTEVPADIAPVIPKGAALSRLGILGDVVLVLAFPPGSPMPIEVGLVDYGEGVSERNPAPYRVIRTDPYEDVGRVTNRYGLRPLNYVARDERFSHVSVLPNLPVTINSSPESPVGRELGLSIPRLDREWRPPDIYTTVELRGGMFSVSDGSLYGTNLIVALQRRDGG